MVKEETPLSDEALKDVTGGTFWDFVKDYYGIKHSTPGEDDQSTLGQKPGAGQDAGSGQS